MGDLGGVLEVLIGFLGVVLYPISEHSFIMKALSILYLARTKSKNVFVKKHSTKKKKKTMKADIPEVLKNTPIEKEIKNHHPIKISSSNNFKLFFANQFCCLKPFCSISKLRKLF